MKELNWKSGAILFGIIALAIVVGSLLVNWHSEKKMKEMAEKAANQSLAHAAQEGQVVAVTEASPDGSSVQKLVRVS